MLHLWKILMANDRSFRSNQRIIFDDISFVKELIDNWPLNMILVDGTIINVQRPYGSHQENPNVWDNRIRLWSYTAGVAAKPLQQGAGGRDEKNSWNQHTGIQTKISENRYIFRGRPRTGLGFLQSVDPNYFLINNTFINLEAKNQKLMLVANNWRWSSPF